jgi:hypothetical protein
MIALALLLGFVPFALHAESGMCEYRHPGHPSWDFFTACTYTVAAEGAATIREVTVSNGSRFVTRDEGGRHSVNDLAARKQDHDDAECWRTEAEDELICIHPVSAVAPAAVAPTTGATAVLDTVFGGGEKGYCLLAERGALVEYGACVRRENCVQMENVGESCLSGYDWASGRQTELARAADWQTLDGGAALPGDPGCLVDTVAALTFCYAAAAMTPDTHPILAPRDDSAVAPSSAD